jgi:hypothetical protein
MENVKLDPRTDGGDDVKNGGRYIRFLDCTSSSVAATWTAINFVTIVEATGFNVDYAGTNCSTAVSLTGSGVGYGMSFANDPMARLTWN